MSFMHLDFWGGPEDSVVFTLDRAANVRLMDDCAFQAYRHGRSYQYHGGVARVSPLRLAPPHHGHWHAVVDMSGYVGSVQARIRVKRRSFAFAT